MSSGSDRPEGGVRGPCATHHAGAVLIDKDGKAEGVEVKVRVCGVALALSKQSTLSACSWTHWLSVPW
jgi:hypothetical protein